MGAVDFFSEISAVGKRKVIMLPVDAEKGGVRLIWSVYNAG